MNKILIIKFIKVVMSNISMSQWDTLFKDWDIPKKHQKKLIQTLNELYKLQYEKDLKLLKADVEYWKSKSKSKPQLGKNSNEQMSLSKEALRLKTQLIEDMLHQITSFEQEQISWKEYLDSFVNKHSMSLSEVYENFKTYSRQMNGNISTFKNEIDVKVKDYTTIEGDIKKTLSEMKLWIETSKNVLDVKNKRIAELEAENLSLTKRFEIITHEIQNQNNIYEQEIKKWKDISLLTIPMVELLNKTLTKPFINNYGANNILSSNGSVSGFSTILSPLDSDNSGPQSNGNTPTTKEFVNHFENGIWNGDYSKSTHNFDINQSNSNNLKEISSQNLNNLDDNKLFKVEIKELENENDSKTPIKVSISLIDDKHNNSNNSINLSNTNIGLNNEIINESLNSTIKSENKINNGFNNKKLDLFNATPISINNDLSLFNTVNSIQFLKCRRMVHHHIGYNPSKKPDHVDGFAKRARFFHPVALALQTNTCIIAEAGNHCLRKLNLIDNLISTITNPQIANSSINSKKFISKIDCPGGICFDPTNPQHVFVTDLNEKKIYSVDIQKGAIFPVKMKSPSKNTISIAIPFNNPYDCTTNEDGTSLYVTHDCGIAIIRLKSRDCIFIGSSTKTGYRDGLLQDCLFDHPNGITFIDKEVFVVCDSKNHVIRLIDLSKGIVKTIGGKKGIPSIRDGALSDSYFNSPRKICSLTGSTVQYLFITEDNSHIRIVDLTNQIVKTIEMKPKLESPFGIAAKFGKHENNIHLYVADCHSHVVTHTELNLFTESNDSQYSEFSESILGDESIHNEGDSDLGNITDEF